MEAIILDVAKTTPILMAHHDLVQTRRMANHILFFKDGLLEANAPTETFFSDPHSAEVDQFLQGQLL